MVAENGMKLGEFFVFLIIRETTCSYEKEAVGGNLMRKSRIFSLFLYIVLLMFSVSLFIFIFLTY